MNFPCTNCGACCAYAAWYGPINAMGWGGEDGACIKWDRKTKKCVVYEERPDCCRAAIMYPTEEKVRGALNYCDFAHLRLYECEREQEGDCPHEEVTTG